LGLVVSSLPVCPSIMYFFFKNLQNKKVPPL
jgi:hypothetical protein